MLAVSLVTGSVVTTEVIHPQIAAAADTDTYPWSNAPCEFGSAGGASCTNPNNKSDLYDWFNSSNGKFSGNGCGSSSPSSICFDNYGYEYRNCTSFVAQKISQEFNGMNISGWGNAANWAAAAQKDKYSLDPVNAPQDGDIAVWGNEVADGFGHVAYVASVTNGVATFDEYNVQGAGTYDNGYTSANHPGPKTAPDWYIHVGTPADETGSQPPQPPQPNNNLYFIKTQNTGSGEIEIHDATGSSGYQASDLHAVTYFNEAEGPNGTWQMWNRNLYDIKTQNTGSGDVEVHDVIASSGYQAADVNAATPFSEADAANGVFEISDTRHANIPDLVFIKERNTGSGHVEVFVSYGPNYNQINVADATAFSEADATNGQFQIQNSDLVYIKTKNTGTGTVEYFRAPVGDNYGTVTLATGTVFSPADAPNGTFSSEDLNANGQAELALVKTQNTSSGQVEVFATNGTNYGQLGLASTTYFSEADAVNGTFELGNGS